jgi:hypothetical protein
VLAPARADEITETLNTVWEVFWQQQGYVQSVSKWREPIRVSVSGTGSQRHRPFVLAQLGRVARSAGIELGEAQPDGPPANFEVEIIADDLTRVGFYFACRTLRTPRVGVIQHVKITAEERALQRCMLHEAMHAVGIPGHPRGASILSYYRGSDKLTSTDELLLRVWYSDELKPGMYALPALAVFARALVQKHAGSEARRSRADRGAVPAPGARAARVDRGRQGRAAADPVPVVDLDAGRARARPHPSAARARSCYAGRSMSFATRSRSACSPNETSWIAPFTKKVGVPRTPLFSPPSICSRTRCG